MDVIIKYLLLAVSLIIAAVFIANVVSLYTTGKSLLDNGKSLINENTSTFTDVDKTQYEGSTVNGSQVADLIKKYWADSNTVAICVCTKDGTNIMYDYSGSTYAELNNLTGFPTNDAANNALASAISSGSGTSKIKQCSMSRHADVDTYDANTGYKDSATPCAGYINRSTGIFKGKVQYDVNNNIRCITLIQQ